MKKKILSENFQFRKLTIILFLNSPIALNHSMIVLLTTNEIFTLHGNRLMCIKECMHFVLIVLKLYHETAIRTTHVIITYSDKQT